MTDGWSVSSPITEAVEELSQRCLRAYDANPDLIEEHFAIERNVAEGGYGRRQIYELVQNGADAALDGGLSDARVEVVLANDALYCANEGDPITPEGLRAILGAHRSVKRGDQIGRFGLGFKSVLAVTDAPQFFSRSGSFAFDPTRTTKAISAIADAERVPSLRLAFPLDPASERSEDEVLAGLMEWAATVVRLPLNRADAAWLHGDLDDFPAEFMLFSSHIGHLILDDRVSGKIREISSSTRGKKMVLKEDDKTATWKLLSTTYHMSEAARRTAGELAERDTLPLVWAVPMDSAAERGWFWAFFPTEYWTTLRGIINAPWKTNADRQNLLKSEFNSELIEKAASLVADNLSLLSAESDPGRYLDYLPGRGRESPQWADALMTEEVYDFCTLSRSVPDLDGKLCEPRRIRLHPPDVPESALELYAAASPQRDWAHPSVEKRSRRARIERIMERSKDAHVTCRGWLEELAGADEIDCRVAVVRVAAALLEAEFEGWQTARIALTARGELVRVDPDLLFFGDGLPDKAGGARLVHPDLAGVPEARAALERLGIRELDAAGRVEALLAGADLNASETWEQFWAASRDIGPEDSHKLVQTHSAANQVMVRTGAGSWARVSVLLKPGLIIQASHKEDEAVACDMEFHAQDQDLLRLLGLVPQPVEGRDPKDEAWFDEYRGEQLEVYLARPEMKRRRPQQNLLVFGETGFVGPCEPLRRLSEPSRLAYTTALLRSPLATSQWSLSHESQDYGVISCPNPTAWMIRKHGLLSTSLGPRPVQDAVGQGLRVFAAVLPVGELTSELAERLRLPNEPEDVSPRALKDALTLGMSTSPEALGASLALALAAGMTAPASIGGTPLKDIVVCSPKSSREGLDELEVSYAFIPADAAAEAIIEAWGLRPAEDLISTQVVAVDAAESVDVADLFPALEALDVDLEVVTVPDLVVKRSSDTGTVSAHVDHHLDGNILYVNATESEPEQVLDAVLKARDIDLSESERKATLTAKRAPSGRRLQAEVLKCTNLHSRVLAAIGREALVRKLPRPLLQEVAARFGRNLTDGEIVEVALAVHGVSVLKEHKDDLRERGLVVPKTWAGLTSTRKFVVGLGFPAEFAGFRSEARDPLVRVPGRPSMPELHDFQKHAARNIRELIRKGEGRGLLSLPTGAGKTRTAVQAIVEAMGDRELEGPVLWVAQTDELCEQAISAWSENWRAVGPRETLNLCRLWSTNEVDNMHDPFQVVVATIAKLSHKFESDEYEWLSRATVVVVDEAHRAISPEYSQLLRWLGMAQGKERVPFIGLSATPYRGTSKEQTTSLVNRFGKRRLDDMGDDPYGDLQKREVLARVEHRLLAGANVHLEPDELAALNQTRRLPASVLERIGEDKGRNQTILDSVTALPEDHTVLLFAASVAHAELMAGLLSIEGIPSRAISAGTDRGARRHYIEQFRRGEVRVLTNYGVLTEGFDAPAVRAVYLARPTYSPNVYQQMIGRGLRGPRNGGKEVCLIVNVADNLAAYGEDLAFREFEPLWNSA